MNVVFSFEMLLLVTFVSADVPVVNTSYGPVKGFEIESIVGKKANIFLGIPFAKPPIGNLRFEVSGLDRIETAQQLFHTDFQKPERPKKWTEVLEAVKLSHACVPHHQSGLVTEDVSEDCLYLNIMAPTEKVVGGYAVMVWIHGGGYNTGGAMMSPYEEITNNFLAREILFVTIQYRLGPLGFMSNGDQVLPGNLGLWDQTAALEFVKENIEHFGGDPTRIVVAGGSAGSSSAASLTLSPYSRDLFTGSIQMSGSVFAEWGTSELVVEASRELAAELSCTTEDSVEMKQCLQGKRVDQFFDAVEKTGKARDGVKNLKYVPRLDNSFFPSDLEKLVKEAPKKPSIIGLTEKEGILFGLTQNVSSLSNMYISPENYEKYGRNNLTEFIRTGTATKKDLGDQAEEVQSKLIEYYANKYDADESDYKYWLKKYTQLLSDVLFNMPVLKEAELKLQDDWPIWLYIVEHVNPMVYPEDCPEKGATHSSEMVYLFGSRGSLDQQIEGSNEVKLKKTMLDTLANFVKYSDPSTEYLRWERATKQAPRNNLRLRPNPVMEETMFDESYRFWKTLDDYDYNIITGKRRVNASGTGKGEP